MKNRESSSVIRWLCPIAAAILAASALSATAKQWPPTYFTSPCACEGDHSEDRKAAKRDPAA